MSGQPAVLQVVILRDGLLVGTEVFVPGSYVLGSGAGSDLVLDDAAVSHEHAFLYFQNGKAAVQDAGSPSGLYVNGHRVNACEVRPVDEVVVGPFVLKVRILAQRAGQKSPAPTQPKPRGPAAVPSIPPVGASAPSRPSPPPAPPTARRPTQTASPAVMGGMAKSSPAPSVAPVPPPPPPQAVNAVRANGIAARNANANGTVPSARRRTGLSVVPAQAHNGAAAAVQMRPEEELTVAADMAELLRRSATPSGAPRKGPRLFALPKKGGKPRLYFELYWHNDRQAAKSFILKKKPLIATSGEGGDIGLYGFKLPPRPFELARRMGDSYRVYVPGGAKVERRGNSGDFNPVAAKDLDVDGTERCFMLMPGQAAKLTEGDMSLFAYVAPTPPKVFVNPLRGVPWLVLFFLTVFTGGLGSFILYGPQPDDAPDFNAQGLPPVAVKLMFPEKKKEEKKKPEKPKEEAKPEKKKEEKPVERVVKHAPKPPPTHQAPPPETAALKALKKIAAGPGTKDILAAMSKLGSGPGAKNNAFKLSGLLGKAPVAINGLGTGGLGGIGGGYGTKGAELLRGRGAGGIGALGVGSVGKGSVQGTVQKAVGHAVAAQGTIDRDAVAKVINSHFQEVRACYERALFKEPGLSGKVSLEWSISTAGKVVSAKTKSSSLRNGAVEACILSSLKTWQFPPAKGGVVIITYPFIFESKGF